MQTGFDLVVNIAKKRDKEIPWDIPDYFVGKLDLPTIVKCNNCNLIMRLVVAHITDGGKTYCNTCVEHDVWIEKERQEAALNG